MKKFFCLLFCAAFVFCGCKESSVNSSATTPATENSTGVSNPNPTEQPKRDVAEKIDDSTKVEEKPDFPVIYSNIEDVPFYDLEFKPIVFEDTGDSIENYFIYRDGEEWISTGPGTTGYDDSCVISNSEYLMVRFNFPFAWHVYSYKRIYDYDQTQARFTPLLYRLDYTTGKDFVDVDADGALVLEDGNRFFLDTMTWMSPEGTVMPNEEGGVGQITVLQGLK